MDTAGLEAAKAQALESELDLFKNRVPEAAARQLAVVLAWLTEAELATLERLEGIKRTPKHELHRHRQIAETAIFHCLDLGVQPHGLMGRKCLRLAEALEKRLAKGLASI